MILKYLKSRSKGSQMPIHLVAAIVLAILFVAIYFAAVNGWLDQVVKGFNTKATSAMPSVSLQG